MIEETSPSDINHGLLKLTAWRSITPLWNRVFLDTCKGFACEGVRKLLMRQPFTAKFLSDVMVKTEELMEPIDSSDSQDDLGVI